MMRGVGLVRVCVILLLLAALPGCETVSGYMPSFAPDPGRTLSQPGLPLPGVAGGAAAAAGDPVALFAAGGSPGGAGMRLGRTYHAASGRECREVLLGGGMAERAQVVCRQPDGSFASTRPLLQGGNR
jgi:hypothetical protein